MASVEGGYTIITGPKESLISPAHLNRITDNLLIGANAFDNVAWVVGGDTVVTPNTTADPNGVVDADTISSTSGTGTLQQAVTVSTIAVGEIYTFEVWLEAGVGTTISIAAFDSDNAGPSYSQSCVVTTSWLRFFVPYVVTTNSSTGITVQISPSTTAITAWGARLYKISNPVLPSSPGSSLLNVGSQDAGDYGTTIVSQTIQPTAGTSLPGVTTYFRMRGQDATQGGVYDTWIVTGAPDFTGSQYSGPLSKPLRDVAVTATWKK